MRMRLDEKASHKHLNVEEQGLRVPAASKLQHTAEGDLTAHDNKLESP